jgi:hypothetical protein
VQVKRKPASPKGRSPDRITPELTEAICQKLELSVPEKYAAQAAGVPERTYYRWVQLGEKGRAPYAAFVAAVTRARASAVCSLTVRVLGGGKGSSGATWLLERRFREDYGPSQKLELSENPANPLGGIRDLLDAMPLTELRERLRKLEK